MKNEKLNSIELAELADKLAKSICYKHTGKMLGMKSLSTSCVENQYCKLRANIPGTICSKCYAQRMHKAYKGLAEKTATNDRLWKDKALPVEALPLVNASLFRLEAFGDLETVFQVENYFNLCRKNKGTKFALWTKNPFVIENAMDLLGLKKPQNLVILISSPYINTVVDISRYPFADKVFTVFDKNHAENVNINCGGRQCLTCGRCYSKRTTKQVNELLHR